MILTRLVLALPVLATVTAAQGSFITPLQAVQMEGNSSSGVTFTNPMTRTQQIDFNLMGRSITSINSLAFRRSNTISRVSSVARTVDVQIDLGYPIAMTTTQLDANFRANTRRTVSTASSFNLPDWTGPTSDPAPFDLEFPFSSPFLYDNSEALVWDLQTANNTGGGSYYMDWLQTTPRRTRGDKPEVLGVGCTTAQGVFTQSTIFSASTNQIMFDWEAENAPANAAVIPLLGLSDPNASIGWCGSLHSDASFIMPAAVADGMGGVSSGITVTYGPALAGVRLYTQLIASDPSQPAGIALSNGIGTSSPYVKAGGSPSDFRIVRFYDVGGHGPVGSGPFATAVPVRYGTN